MTSPVAAHSVPPPASGDGDYGGRGPLEEAEPELWCAGLPLVGKRLFTEGERDAARRERIRARVLGLAGMIAFLALPGSITLLAVLGKARVQSAHPAAAPESFFVAGFSALITLGLLVSPVVGALLMMSSFKALRALDRERRAAHVMRFAGTVPGKKPRELGARALVRARLVKEGEKHAIDVAEGSLRLLAVDDRAPNKSFLLPVTNVAVLPPEAATAAAWLRPLHGRGNAATRGNGPRILASSRLLSADERAELEAHERRLAGAVKVWLWSLGISLAMFAALTRVRVPRWIALSVGIVFLAAAMWDSRKGLARMRAVRGLRADLRERRLDVYARAPAPGAEAAPATNEILAKSRLPWTIQGAPAAWRTTSKGVPRRF